MAAVAWVFFSETCSNAFTDRHEIMNHHFWHKVMCMYTFYTFISLPFKKGGRFNVFFAVKGRRARSTVNRTTSWLVSISCVLS